MIICYSSNFYVFKMGCVPKFFTIFFVTFYIFLLLVSVKKFDQKFKKFERA